MNVFVISGNLGGNLDIRFTPAGKAIGEFSVPVEQGWGEHKKTSWITCKLIGDRATKLQQYLVKGKEVTVSGEFVFEQWEKNGVKTGKPVMIVNNVTMHKGGDSMPSENHSMGAAKELYSQAPASSGFDNFDDDIPF